MLRQYKDLDKNRNKCALYILWRNCIILTPKAPATGKRFCFPTSIDNVEYTNWEIWKRTFDCFRLARPISWILFNFVIYISHKKTFMVTKKYSKLTTARIFSGEVNKRNQINFGITIIHSSVLFIQLLFYFFLHCLARWFFSKYCTIITCSIFLFLTTSLNGFGSDCINIVVVCFFGWDYYILGFGGQMLAPRQFC